LSGWASAANGRPDQFWWPEVWEPEHRGKAIGLVQSGWALGYIAAAILAAAIIPTMAGDPYSSSVSCQRCSHGGYEKNIPEPELWRKARQEMAPSTIQVLTRIFTPPYLRITFSFIVLSSVLMFAYWGLSPGFRHTSPPPLRPEALACRW
jgi:MFS family permease